MVGLGEEWDEVVATLRDLRAAGCQIVTIGQYLRPSLANLPMERYYTPAEFAELKRIGLELGFGHVESGPLVRSSYHAHEQTEALRSGSRERSARPTPSRKLASRDACQRLVIARELAICDAEPLATISDDHHLHALRAAAHLLRAHRPGEEGRAPRRHLLGPAGAGFGDPQARVLVLGLAPAAHGANRTGRVFTGDGPAARATS